VQLPGIIFYRFLPPEKGFPSLSGFCGFLRVFAWIARAFFNVKVCKYLSIRKENKENTK